jgi:hypothetical protein
MPDQWNILKVEQHLISGQEVWAVDRQRQGDKDFKRHYFPNSTIEWRAAEYDLDHTTPEGRADILDIVLHEPFIARLNPQITPPKPKTINGRLMMVSERAEEVHLYNAPTKGDALKAHRDRVARVKQQVAQVGASELARTLRKSSNEPASMLQAIIDWLPDDDRVAEKRMAVFIQRAKMGLEVMPARVVKPRLFDPSIVEQSKQIKLEIARSNKNASAEGAPES